MDAMRSAAHKVTEVVFPGMKISYSHKFSRKSEEVLSSLPLQMCLYFNVNYSPLWILVRIGCLIYKVPELAGFWLLTLFLQFPLQCLCTFNTDFVILPWERMTDCIMMLFLVLEIGVLRLNAEADELLKQVHDKCDQLGIKILKIPNFDEFEAASARAVDNRPRREKELTEKITKKTPPSPKKETGALRKCPHLFPVLPLSIKPLTANTIRTKLSFAKTSLR
ncbi:transmembrane protein 17B [Caerostris extrusa]|uniref:Transmembrane protein 17B n=1 Tax=Caerostris extrusa TaxID=172846 RepID=A0AAV4S9Q9_CAEEX|nr:transmembrane protein 17B [Caerostris extrusa]